MALGGDVSSHRCLAGDGYRIVCVTFLNLGYLSSFRIRARIIGMGNPTSRSRKLNTSELRRGEFQYQLAIYIYEKGLGNAQFSMSTAVGLFQSLVGLFLVLLSDRVAKQLGEDGLL